MLSQQSLSQAVLITTLANCLLVWASTWVIATPPPPAWWRFHHIEHGGYPGGATHTWLAASTPVTEVDTAQVLTRDSRGRLVCLLSGGQSAVAPVQKASSWQAEAGLCTAHNRTPAWCMIMFGTCICLHKCVGSSPNSAGLQDLQCVRSR
jgi:hypothetical protein